MSEIEENLSWIDLAAFADLKPGRLLKAQAAGHTLALGLGPDGAFCLKDACAHEGGSLSEGSFDGACVTCPLHALRYDVKDGSCATDARYTQKRYDVKVENGRVLAELPQAAPAADPATVKSSVELWKVEKHGFDCWPDILRFAKEGTPMAKMTAAEMERMKWYGFFYRKTNDTDHYMTRIRIPGCDMTSAQMKAMAFIAYESGYSLLDVTTRGNMQIQGLTIDKLPGVAAALEAVGLSAKQTGHDNVRNVTSLPLAGIDPEELIDTRELARAVDALILDSREFSDLPRKFNPGFCGRERAAAHVWTQDLSFVAMKRGEGVAFRVLLGGTQGQTPTLAWPAPVLVLPEQVVPVTAAILRAFKALGWRNNRHQVRMHFLMERIGNEAFLEAVEKELGYKLERTDSPIPPAEREEVFVGWQAQKQPGLWALGVCVPVGRLTWQQAQGLAELAERFGGGSIRTTLDQNLIVPHIPTAKKAEAEHALAALGLSHESDSITRQVVSCTGKQFCNLAIGETKGYAFQLIEELRRRQAQLHGVTIHMSGCPNSCGMTLTADIGLQGTKARKGKKTVDAFDVYLGGGVDETVHLAQLLKKGVPTEELPHFIEQRIAEWRAGRSEGQGFSAWWRNKLAADPPDFSQDVARRWACGKCSHLHVGEVPPTSCPVCSSIRSKFEPANDEVEMGPGFFIKGAALPKPAVAAPKAAEAPGKRVVIVGSGIAAHSAAQAARVLDPKAQISLLGDEPAFYNRLNLTRWLGGEMERPALFDFGPDWAKTHKIETRFGAQVSGLDTSAKELRLMDGSRLSFDACILAHGSSPSLPVFWREGLAGLTALRSLNDFDAIQARLVPGEPVAVIGGGVLGVEAAAGLAAKGAKVVLIELQPRLMPRQLDAESAGMLKAHLESKGIQVLCGQSVRELRGEKEVDRLVFGDGSELAIHQVLVCAGVAPNVGWLRAAGLDCGRGVKVDDQMQTNAPGVLACGDVAEWQGRVFGLWAHAQEQAAVAAANALGKPKVYGGTLVVTILKCAGVDCVSIGEIPSDSQGVSSRTSREDGVYRRLFLRQGFPVGAILYGSAAGIGDWRKLVEDGLALEALQKRLLPLDALVAA